MTCTLLFRVPFSCPCTLRTGRETIDTVQRFKELILIISSSECFSNVGFEVDDLNTRLLLIWKDRERMSWSIEEFSDWYLCSHDPCFDLSPTGIRKPFSVFLVNKQNISMNTWVTIFSGHPISSLIMVSTGHSFSTVYQNNIVIDLERISPERSPNMWEPREWMRGRKEKLSERVLPQKAPFEHFTS